MEQAMMNTEQYLLTCLVEELAELQHALSKCLRFTTEDLFKGQPFTNLQQANDEYSDVLAILQLLQYNGVYLQPSLERILLKKNKTEEYMVYSRTLGVLMDDDSNNRR